MLILTDQNFEKIIKENAKPILVDFYADWCPPCRVLSPILERLEKEYEEKIIFAKVNVDASPVISQKFGINPIPTVVLLKKGEAVSSFVGLRPEEEIKAWLESLLNSFNS